MHPLVYAARATCPCGLNQRHRSKILVRYLPYLVDRHLPVPRYRLPVPNVFRLTADFVGEPGNELEEVAVASEIESSTADEVEPDVAVDQSDESADLEIESVKEEIEASEESEADADVTTEDQEATDSVDQEAKAKSDAEAAEEQLRKDLEDAETAALNAQLEIEKEEFLEDLSVLDGRILPQLKVPDWREELEFVKERYEPCDLSDHIVKVSKRRLTARQIDHELAESRLSAYLRYFERASRRFKDKIEEIEAHVKSYVDEKFVFKK
jgi:hypothetical protein